MHLHFVVFCRLDLADLGLQIATPAHAPPTPPTARAAAAAAAAATTTTATTTCAAAAAACGGGARRGRASRGGRACVLP